MRRKWISSSALLGIVLVTFIGGEVVRLLWNWLLPPLFGWPQIPFWQAIGILALCGSSSAGSGATVDLAHSALRRRMADRMADRVAERWERMTPEGENDSGNASANVAASTLPPPRQGAMRAVSPTSGARASRARRCRRCCGRDRA